MYGTIARMRPLPGKFEQLREVGESWRRERAPQLSGVVASYVMVPDATPDEVLMVSIWADRETYIRNAADPEQDRFYQRIRALLTDDPTWQDGEFFEG